MKNRSFLERMAFARDGIVWVWQHEASFRTQAAMAVAAILVTALLQPGWLWAAIVSLAIAFVLAFELMNSALEYAIDRLHPEIADAIRRAKDAAAGAVLVASFGALVVGLFMLAARLVAS